MKFSHVSAFSFGRDKKRSNIYNPDQLERTDRLYTPGPGQYEPNLSMKRTDPRWKYLIIIQNWNRSKISKRKKSHTRTRNIRIITISRKGSEILNRA